MSNWGVVFPGQGSQSPGMGRYLYDEFQVAREMFEEAGDAVSVDYKKLCFDGSEQDLALTENTQPCLLLVSAVTYRVLRSIADFKPIAAAGHSVGEYSALVASKTIGFAEGIRAVRSRGKFMQEAVAVGTGGMMAIMGLTSEQVETVCKWVSEQTNDGPLEPANFNSPEQTVISGKASLIEWLANNFKGDMFLPEKPRYKFIPLKVSAPFHSSMMKPVEEKMDRVLRNLDFRNPLFPIIPNVTAKPVKIGEELRKLLIRQICAPVRWMGCVEEMRKMGVQNVLECGSGKVLSGLTRKISPEGLRPFSINSLEDLKALETALQ